MYLHMVHVYIGGLAWDWITKTLYWVDVTQGHIDVLDPLTNNSKTLFTSSVGSKLQAIVLDPTIRYEELVLKYNAYVLQSLNNSKVDVLDRLW